MQASRLHRDHYRWNEEGHILQSRQTASYSQPSLPAHTTPPSTFVPPTNIWMLLRLLPVHVYSTRGSILPKFEIPHLLRVSIYYYGDQTRYYGDQILLLITPTHKGKHEVMSIQTIIMRTSTHSMQARPTRPRHVTQVSALIPITKPPQWGEQLPRGTNGRTPLQASPTMPYTSDSYPGTTPR
jgi:hypothetical protein